MPCFASDRFSLWRLRLRFRIALLVFALSLSLVANAAAPRAPRCDICKRQITGRYYQGNGRIVCAKCFGRHAKCAMCGLPDRKLYPVGDDKVCATCYHKAPKCSSCEGPIVGKYYRIPHQRGQFCKTCFEERPHCDFCNRPIVKGGRELADGRRTCAQCAADSVADLEEALDILASVARFMEAQYGMVVRKPYDFVLVDNTAINLVLKRPADTPMKELGLYSQGMIPGVPRPIILILTDLPRRAFLEVTAHEYAHLWMFENNPGVTDPEVVEGFAQWMAAKWLEREKQFSALAHLESRTDPHYGTGYRQLHGLEVDQSMSDVFRYVLQLGREADQAPAWPQQLYASQNATAARAQQVKPLKEIVPAFRRSGPWAFLNRAVPIVPESIRLRRPTEVREAVAGD